MDQRLIEILDEKDKQKVKSPRSLSGLHTPVGRAAVGNNSASSVRYYFDELNNHFRANNDMNRFGITLSKYVCEIYDGKNRIHEVPVDHDDSSSIRNLYLMFFASDYNVLTFIAKKESGEFESFDGTDDKGARIDTPPKFNQRSDVFVFGK